MELRQYQLDGIDWMRDRPRTFLGDDMGLGKTASLLHAAQGRTMVVAPGMVLDGGAWSDDITKWGLDPEQFTLVSYTSLCHRDGRKTLPRVKQVYDQRWDTIICDEAHYLKGRDTLWTRALDKLTKKAGTVRLATGTPIMNYAPELFSLLRILDPAGARNGARFGSYWRWAGEWFDTTPETIYVRGQEKEVNHVGEMLACNPGCGDRPPTDPCQHYRDFFEQNLGGVFLQRLRDQVLADLPPLTTQVVHTPMVPAQRKAYQAMRKDFLAELADGSFKMAWSASARHVMLDKISTGLGILDDSLPPASGKLDRLAFDLAARSRPTLVVAHYRASVEAAARTARSVGASVEFIHGGTSSPDRQARVRAFQAGTLDVLVGSLETVAEGLTLTAADVVIQLESSYKPSRNQQAVRRIHRLGQTRPCTVLDYITPDTVDERKRELLASKTDAQIRTLSPAQLRGIV